METREWSREEKRVTMRERPGERLECEPKVGKGTRDGGRRVCVREEGRGKDIMYKSVSSGTFVLEVSCSIYFNRDGWGGDGVKGSLYKLYSRSDDVL